VVKALRNDSYSSNLARHVKLPYRATWFNEVPQKYIGEEQK
jgi:hypothetical protein